MKYAQAQRFKEEYQISILCSSLGISEKAASPTQTRALSTGRMNDMALLAYVRAIRDDWINESKGKLLGQRRDGDALRFAEGGTSSWNMEFASEPDQKRNPR